MNLPPVSFPSFTSPLVSSPLPSSSLSSSSSLLSPGRSPIRSWVPNSNRSGFFACPTHPVFSSQRAFQTPNPGGPSGPYWRALFRPRPGQTEEVQLQLDQGQYYGLRPELLQRVQHNACSSQAHQQDQIYPFYYRHDDFPNPGEAFKAADGWWGGRGPPIPAWTFGSSSSRGNGPVPLTARFSHLEAGSSPLFIPTTDKGEIAVGLHRSDILGAAQALHPTIYQHPAVEACSPTAQVSGVKGSEAGNDRGSCRVGYSPYPMSPVHFRMEQEAFEPSRDMVPGCEKQLPGSVMALGRELDAKMSEWIRAGIDLHNRPFYCGTRYEPYIRHLQTCPSLVDQKRREFQEKHSDDGYREADLPLVSMGNPGQCFQYGRTYALPPPARHPLYFHEKEVPMRLGTYKREELTR